MIENLPLVSIVIVTYNSSKTLVETLDSVAVQTYQNLELIVSDDCSKDGTLAVAKRWMKAHSHRFTAMKLLKANSNHGVVKNCNIGINQANGKYVQEFAGDDILHPDAIEKKVAFAEENHLDTVFVKTRPFGTNRKAVSAMTKRCEVGYKIIEQGYDSQKKAIIHDNFLGGPSGGFYRTEFFKEMGGYDLRYPQMEDWPFLYHYIKSGKELVLLDEYLIDYRVSGTSLCTSYNRAFIISSFRFFIFERLWSLLSSGDMKTAWSSIVAYKDLFRKSK